MFHHSMKPKRPSYRTGEVRKHRPQFGLTAPRFEEKRPNHSAKTYKEEFTAYRQQIQQDESQTSMVWFAGVAVVGILALSMASKKR
jgi:hypothetical protein